MAYRHVNRDRYPSNWPQLYALAYGELSAMIDSYLEGLISKEDLRDLYRAQADAQYVRVQQLVECMSNELQTAKPPE